MGVCPAVEGDIQGAGDLLACGMAGHILRDTGWVLRRKV